MKTPQPPTKRRHTERRRSTGIARPPGTSESARGRKRNLGRERVVENAGKPAPETGEQR